MKTLNLNSILICISVAMWVPTASMAEIYKRVDENGHVTYSNVPLKGASKLNLDPNPPNTGAARAAKTPTPEGFPKVDNKTQTQRDDKRREILLAELDAEKKALETAKQAYQEGEANPEVSVGAGGKRFRNVVKFEEKMAKLKTDVDTHQRNVELLQKELNNL